jgi:hypothetical protein
VKKGDKVFYVQTCKEESKKIFKAQQKEKSFFLLSCKNRKSRDEEENYKHYRNVHKYCIIISK